ncbi:MAG: fibronectin type III domain-containing protein [Candidatus Zixiibacteriota bacterium]
MRKIILSLVFLLALSFIFSGCEERIYVVKPDTTPPSIPKGIYSITADEAVWLFWEENDEKDLAGYRIYRKTDPESNKYYYLVTVDTAGYIDYNVKNGKTYYYGVTAFDYDGNESDLSYVTYDTPRPEGFGEIIQDYHRYPKRSGYDFSEDAVVSYDDEDTDIYLDYDDYYKVYFLCVRDEYTDIQDFGYTDKLDDVNVSPETGWSGLGWVEVILGHSYIIWTRDNHFAKLRVNGFIRSYGIVFDWAYQIDEGNPELAPRPDHGDNYLRVAVRR